MFRFYSAKSGLLAFSIISLFCCYLTVGTVFSFASLIERKASIVFNAYFKGAAYVVTGRQGLVFRNGELFQENVLPSQVLTAFRRYFPTVRTLELKNPLTRSVTHIVIYDQMSGSAIQDFSRVTRLQLLSSYKLLDSAGANGYFYNLNDYANRFSIFSFKNQLSAAVLGEELSTEVGSLARILFFAAALLTVYVTVLYFQERKTESAILLIQGFIDQNLRITFLDCALQNVVALLLTCLTVPCILAYFTDGIQEMKAGLSGLVFILPYLPVITIVQLLLLVNKSLSYASRFE